MAIISTPYDHTTRLFFSGSCEEADVYQVILCSSLTFNAADTTLAGVTYTEVANGDGYTTGGQALANVAVTTASVNGCIFDGDDVQWTASGAGIAATHALVFNNTLPDDPPLVAIDLDGLKTAVDGVLFLIEWNVGGIFSVTVTP